MEIKEIKERLSLIEKIAEKYDYKFEEVNDYVALDGKLCIFPFFDETSSSLKDVRLYQNYSKIIAISDNDSEESYGVINIISKATIKKIIDANEDTLNDGFLAYLNNDYKNLFFKQAISLRNEKADVKSKEKGTHKLEKGINVNPLESTYEEVGKHVYFSKESNQYVLLLESKSYDKRKYKNYWYSIHQNHIERLENKNSFILFQFKDSSEYILIPYNNISKQFPKLGKTVNDKETYYHVYIDKFDNDGYFLRIPNEGREDINCYVNKLKSQVENNVFKKTVIKIKTTGVKEVTVKKP